MTRHKSKSRSKGRRRRNQPVIGGVAHDDSKQARQRKAKEDQVTLAKRAREQLKLPTTEEVVEVGRSKER